ncbi:hypothetical protein COCNU_09G007350 [Cocos nucifera]|uniref:Uncharacterized protein n=1 Tax=Cocos nucifera TaxID=13894 RepID=A0A8K0IKB4_COCNU|nr:hypothetical protein COCNU_09G007350 [Cocos nucifera]
MENSGFLACEKLDRVPNWVGASVSSAFFASLERCSCINLRTTDNEEKAETEAAKDRPVMLDKPIAPTAAAEDTNADKLPSVFNPLL